MLVPSCEIKEMLQPGCEQSNSVRLNTAKQRLKRRVSVLADGLSVKVLTDALNQQSNGLNALKFRGAAWS